MTEWHVLISQREKSAGPRNGGLKAGGGDAVSGGYVYYYGAQVAGQAPIGLVHQSLTAKMRKEKK